MFKIEDHRLQKEARARKMVQTIYPAQSTSLFSISQWLLETRIVPNFPAGIIIT